ncbi:MAG: hypothetical protein RIR43_816 [Pseudomonadota bacterium]
MADQPDLRQLYPGLQLPGDPGASKPATPPATRPTDNAPAAGAASLADIYPGAVLPPTEGEIATEIGKGLVQGGVKYGPATAGMVMGAKAGSVVAPFTGPFAPVVPFIGGGLGLVGGYLLGESLDDKLFEPPSRPELVPYREGAITAGGALTSSPAAFFARGNVATRFGRLMDYMGRTARARPATYLGIEGLTATSAGLAGGTSEAYFPGEAGTRFGAELAASVFTPGRFLLNTTTSAYDGVKNLIRTARDPQAVQFKQANALYNVLDRVLAEVPAIQQLEQLGTPQALQQAAQLRDRYYKNLIRDLEKIAPGKIGIDPARPTAAQKTGDLGLAILELSLAKGDKAFGSVVQQQGIDALRANQALIDAMNNIPDQRFLALAAQKQAELYDNMVAGRLGLAERAAADAARAINLNNPQSRRAIGGVIKGQVDTALEEARDYEKLLWNQALQATALRTVPSGARKGQIVERELVPKQLLRSYLDEISGMTMERATGGMPAEVKAIMTRLGITQESIAAYQKGKLTQQFRDTGVVPDEYLIAGIETLKNGKTRVIPLGNKTTVQDLINIRSDMLKYARDAAAGTANRSPSDARFFGTLAEGALDDLQTLNSAVYDKARAFSKSLNDVFRRTYANQLTSVERTGADKIPAELLVSRAFGRDADATAMRMDQIEGAVGFFKNAYDDAVAKFGPTSRQAMELKPMADASAKNVASVTDAMERALRVAATDPTIVNPQTGRVNPQALANWMTRNQEVLKPFGSLTNDLKTALDAENAFKALGDPNSAVNRQLRDQQAFAALLPGGERPTIAVTSILNSANPVAGMRKLADVVKNTQQGGGPAAIEGLKSSLLEYAYTKAGGTSTNKFSIAAFDDALFQPLAPGQPSIVNIMRANGLMSLTEIKDLRRVMDPMKKVEAAMGNRVYLDEIIAGTGPVSDLAVRLLSLHGASGVIPEGPGSLAASSAISRAAKDVFNQLPRLNALAALKETIQDPQLTAAMLRVGRTDAEKMAILQNIKDRMSATGLIMQVAPRAVVPAGNVTPQAQQEQQQRRDAARMLRSLPPAPTTRGVPGMTSPGGQKPPGPQGQAPAGGGGAPTQSRAMLQSLFPFDSISAMAAQGQPQQPPPA